MADKQRELVDLARLEEHHPKFSACGIEGCKCGWEPHGFGDGWEEYLSHIPRFGATGILGLSTEDRDWLKKQRITDK